MNFVGESKCVDTKALLAYAHRVLSDIQDEQEEKLVSAASWIRELLIKLS
jgi:hypothetical protein